MSSMSLGPNQTNELLFIGFNQDYGCFACGTDNGFRIYNVDPYRETFRRMFANGGIGIVEMLFRTNLLALVGGGRSPRFPPNKVMIWDDHQNRCIGELSFRSEVKAVKLRRDRVVVVLTTKIYVYRFSDLQLLDQMNTLPNPKGLVALSPDSSNTVLACPGINKGSVRVELYDSRKSTLISAHESELAQIALNLDGARLATASDKGTLVRVWDTYSGELLQELRRGMDRAEIYSLAFNQTSTFLACSSCKGTIHIFSLVSERGRSGSGASEGGQGAGSEGRYSAEGPPVEPKNATSGLLPGVTPKYFGSEWSYAQVRGHEAKTVVAFGSKESTIISVSADGSYVVSNFAKGGEAERVSYKKIIRSAEEEADDLHFGGGPSGAFSSLPQATPYNGSNTIKPIIATTAPSVPADGKQASAGDAAGAQDASPSGRPSVAEPSQM